MNKTLIIFKTADSQQIERGSIGGGKKVDE